MAAIIQSEPGGAVAVIDAGGVGLRPFTPRLPTPRPVSREIPQNFRSFLETQKVADFFD